MKRSPAAAFWLSLLPGLGHLYLGLTMKGFVLALLAVGLIDITDRGADAFGIMIPIYWLFVMLDAHRSAQAINRGASTPDALFASGSRWWGLTLIVLGVAFLLYNFGLFDFDWVWRFWPVALIVIGIKLIKPSPLHRTEAPPLTPSPPPPGDASTADAAGEVKGPAAEQGEPDEPTAAG